MNVCRLRFPDNKPVPHRLCGPCRPTERTVKQDLIPKRVAKTKFGPIKPPAASSQNLKIGMNVQPIAALALCLVSAPALSQGHIPEPCATAFQAAGLDVDHLRCSTPYVELELMPHGHDEVFERNFLCVETGYSLGVGHGDVGCGTSEGVNADWALPPTTPDYEAEVQEHVIDACYLEAAALLRPNPDYEYMLAGLTDQQGMVVLKGLANQEAMDELMATVIGIVAGLPETERRALYSLARRSCLEGFAVN